MWKKDESGDETPAEKRGRKPDRSPEDDVLSAGSSPAGQATIGSSIRIQGEVTGDEDLLIQGHVEGTVDLAQQSVTVGPDGEVTADITGRVITVEGQVEGDLSGEEQVILRSSARVEGDISAPRVVLEDGARFRGGVEMGEMSDRARKSDGAGRSTSKPSAPAGGSSLGSSGRQGSGNGKDESDRSEKAAGTAKQE